MFYPQTLLNYVFHTFPIVNKPNTYMRLHIDKSHLPGRTLNFPFYGLSTFRVYVRMGVNVNRKYRKDGASQMLNVGVVAVVVFILIIVVRVDMIIISSGQMFYHSNFV